MPDAKLDDELAHRRLELLQSIGIIGDELVAIARQESALRVERGAVPRVPTVGELEAERVVHLAAALSLVPFSA